MKKLLLFLSIVVFFYDLQAQDTSLVTPKKLVPSVATIRTLDGKTLKGLFYQVNDSQVVLLDKASQYPKMTGKTNVDKYGPTQTIRIEQIQSLSLRKKNSVIKGLLIGFGTGVVTGVVIGLASGNDPITPYPDPSTDLFGIGAFTTGLSNAFAMSAGEKALGAGFALGITGAITGTIIGAITEKKFIIGGSRKKLRDLDGEFRQRLMIR